MNDIPSIPARLVVLRPPRTGRALQAGGMELLQRWRTGLSRAGLEVRGTDEPEVASLLAAAVAPVVVADGGAVLEPEALAHLVKVACADDEVVTFRDEAGHLAAAVLLGAQVARRIAGSILDPDLLRRPGNAAAPPRVVDLRGLAWPEPPDQAAANAITRTLLQRLRLRPGGLVARHVNRHVSIRMTYWLLKTSITPNQVTTLTGLLALCASVAMLPAGYAWGLLAVALMQLSSILDGCDGEIARIRYQSSEFGKWYDSAWDEVVNALFMAAVGWHVAVTYPDAAWAGWALGAGVFSGIVNYVYGMANFHCKWVHGVGLYWWFDTPPAPRPADAPVVQPSLWSEFKTIFGRDAYLFAFFLAGVVNLLPVMLLVITGASLVFFVLLFTHVVIARGRW